MRVTKNSNIDTQSVDASAIGKSRRAEKAKAEQATRAEDGAASVGDTSKVDLSPEAKAMAKANAVAKSDNVDQAKIDRIKALINAKQYNPDMGAVADKMVNEHILQELS
ncbi:MAG: flagellar biosynthesis anti-sigma factor FlgM [Bdellovibrionales bacterium]|nr:flagellar biosynthesis anti-sigma factor FlgM [Bdellovibrionales bacterium]